MRYAPLAVVSLLGSLVTGCPDGPVPQPDAGPVFYDDAPVTEFTGYVWDPEVFFISVATCAPPPDCEAGDPFNELPQGHFRRSVISGATVDVVTDPATSVAAAPATDEYGTFHTPPVPSNTTYYLRASPTAETALLDPPPTHFTQFPSPPMDPPVPAATYLPTVLVRPLNAERSWCYIPRVTMASHNGVLDAVVRGLNAFSPPEAPPLTVNDLVNPDLFGGVLIWYLYGQGFSSFSVPADSTNVTSSVGMTFQVTWAPVGALPPELEPLQSERGFVLAPPDPDSGVPVFGIAVTLLDPSPTPTEVTMGGEDTFTEPLFARPWTFTPRTVTVHPGVISYGFQLADLQPDRMGQVFDFSFYVDPPEYWRCVEPGPLANEW